MKNISRISFFILLLFSACEKSIDEGYSFRFYGDAWEDIGYSLAIASDGYLLAGQFQDLYRENNTIIEDSANRNMAIIKTDWNGTMIWKKSLGGKGDDNGRKLYQNSDGSMICVGTYSSSSTGRDIFVAKLSSTGDVQWEKTFGGADNQQGKDVISTPDGYMILGTTDAERLPLTDSTGNQQGKSDIYLLKITGDGTFVDSFAYGFPGNDEASVIKNDAGGNFIVLGTTDRSEPGQGENNLLLVKINSIGYAIQPKILGSTSDEYAADLEVLSDGYLIVGTVGNSSTIQEAYITKVKQDIYKEPFFTNIFRLNNLSTAINAVTVYGTDKYLVAGSSGISPGTKMLVFEINQTGEPVEGKSMIRGGSGDQVAYDVVAGDDGYILAVGRSRYDVNSMISLLKFRF
jgi:hypothetical protein